MLVRSRRKWSKRPPARGTLLALVALSGLLGAASASPARAEVAVLVLDGTGYGHGVGLSQWGAEYLARTGRTADEILATFYPGTSMGRASGVVRVTVHQPPTRSTVLSFPQGGEVRSPRQGTQASGFPVRVGPGGRVRISFDGASYRVEALVAARSAQQVTRYQQMPCTLPVACAPPTVTAPPSTTTTTTTAPEPSTTAPEKGSDSATPGAAAAPSSRSPVWAVPAESGVTAVDDRGRSYRGMIEATGGDRLRLVNELGVEDYLRGMAEVPGTWPAAAIEAQTIAARTYALRAMQAGGELCDDARCQVYAGRSAESPGEDAAVYSTAGRVLTYSGALASAVYSADAGGVSATTAEGFGTPDGVYPYLTTVRYPTDNPLPWHLDVALHHVGSRLGYPGALSDVRVTRTGPSGRALEVVLTGSSGDVTVDGRLFARSLGLRSTRFTASMGTADGAPPPPPGEEAIQALPEQAATLAQRPRSSRASELDGGPARTPLPTPGDGGKVVPSARALGILAALLLASGVTGAHVPVALARRLDSTRP